MTDPTLARLEADALAAVKQLGVPPCPHVLSEIGRELHREVPNVDRIAELITHDATSSAAILKAANSMPDGSGSKARSVQQAIANVGSNHASYLIGGLLLRNAFPRSHKGALIRFWDTTTELAVCAAYVASELGAVDRNEAHTYALFRNIGSAVLVCKFDDYDEASLQARAKALSSIAAAEKERFGTDRAQIGAGLARDWQLPEEMIEAILWHHADDVFDAGRQRISSASLRLIAIGTLCDRIVDDYEGTEASTATMQSTAKALRVLDLPTSQFEALQAEATELLDQIEINAMPTIRVHRFPERRSDE